MNNQVALRAPGALYNPARLASTATTAWRVARAVYRNRDNIQNSAAQLRDMARYAYDRARVPFSRRGRVKASGRLTSVPKRRRSYRGKRRFGRKKRYSRKRRGGRKTSSVVKTVMKLWPWQRASYESFVSHKAATNEVRTFFFGPVGSATIDLRSNAANPINFRLNSFYDNVISATDAYSDLAWLWRKVTGNSPANTDIIKYSSIKVLVERCRMYVRLRNNMNLRVRVRVYQLRHRDNIKPAANDAIPATMSGQATLEDPQNVFDRFDDNPNGNAVSSGPLPEARPWKTTLHHYHGFAVNFKILSVKTFVLDPGESKVLFIKSPVEGKIVQQGIMNNYYTTRWTRYLAMDVMGDNVYQYVENNATGSGPAQIDCVINHQVKGRQMPNNYGSLIAYKHRQTITQPGAVPIDSNTSVLIGN